LTATTPKDRLPTPCARVGDEISRSGPSCPTAYSARPRQFASGIGPECRNSDAYRNVAGSWTTQSCRLHFDVQKGRQNSACARSAIVGRMGFRSPTSPVSNAASRGSRWQDVGQMLSRVSAASMSCKEAARCGVFGFRCARNTVRGPDKTRHSRSNQTRPIAPHGKQRRTVGCRLKERSVYLVSHLLIFFYGVRTKPTFCTWR